MRSFQFASALMALGLLMGCSGTDGTTTTDTDPASTSPVTGSTIQSITNAPTNSARACLRQGPKSMSFQSHDCNSTVAHMEYTIVGSDGSGSGSYFWGTTSTPNYDFTGGTEDLSVSCDPMTAVITAIGPADISSDKAWRFFSATQAAIDLMFFERYGRQPVPDDYFSDLTHQAMLDAWSCNHTTPPGQGICPTNATPVTFSSECRDLSYTAGSSICSYSFTIAQRN
jgi:hypothetical protein